MFKITRSKGFHITFPNGITLSTQFGGGNYGDNHNLPIGSESSLQELKSAEVEVAVWNNSGQWLTNNVPCLGQPGDVAGHVPVEKWVEVLNWCSTYMDEKGVQP